MDNAVFAGIDEAGRGAVIGPLVVAGVSLYRKDEGKLLALGVKDSKLLSPRQREAFEKRIEGIARDIVVIKVSACKIDNMRKGGVNLNRLEAMKFADTLSLLNPGTAYIDCPDVDTGRMGLLLRKMAGERELVVEHKADVTYPIVSAASIIAKVARDREVEGLKKEYGDFGPGYSSNEKTIAWLRAWMETHKDYPDIVRRSWETARRIRNAKAQSGVAGFLKKLAGREEGCAGEPAE